MEVDYTVFFIIFPKIVSILFEFICYLTGKCLYESSFLAVVFSYFLLVLYFTLGPTWLYIIVLRLSYFYDNDYVRNLDFFSIYVVSLNFDSSMITCVLLLYVAVSVHPKGETQESLPHTEANNNIRKDELFLLFILLLWSNKDFVRAQCKVCKHISRRPQREQTSHKLFLHLTFKLASKSSLLYLYSL